jgi:hypothetical protein
MLSYLQSRDGESHHLSVYHRVFVDIYMTAVLHCTFLYVVGGLVRRQGPSIISLGILHVYERTLMALPLQDTLCRYMALPRPCPESPLQTRT